MELKVKGKFVTTSKVKKIQNPFCHIFVTDFGITSRQPQIFRLWHMPGYKYVPRRICSLICVCLFDPKLKSSFLKRPQKFEKSSTQQSGGFFQILRPSLFF